MDSSLRWSKRTVMCCRNKRSKRCFGILHTENRTGEMVMKEHMPALLHLLPKMFCVSMIL